MMMMMMMMHACMHAKYRVNPLCEHATSYVYHSYAQNNHELQILRLLWADRCVGNLSHANVSVLRPVVAADEILRSKSLSFGFLFML